MNNRSRNWKDKRVAVLGLGVEGLSSAKFLVQQGAEVTVLDQKREDELDPKARKILRDLDTERLGGKGYLDNLDEYDVIVRSPGIKRTASPLIDVEKKGAIITSHTKLFFDLCPCPIIGVTGTKGKGTTSALIHEMLGKEGFAAYLGGNIGKPPLDFLNTLSDRSKVVLELSSYQLQDFTKSPHVAVVLMVTREHLAPDRGGRHENYHPSIEDYVSAKRNILRFQTPSDFAVVNKDYPSSKESDIHTEAKLFSVSTEGEVEEGCFIEGQKVKVKIQKSKKEVIDTKDILLPGRHNLENVCAAVMAALCAGVSISSIVSVLKTFKGLEHRLELVREVGGVRYYDDSFSTTPETAIAAIQAFTNPEILILGGAHKGSDFNDLGRVIAQAKNIKAVIGIGKEWKRMKSQFSIFSPRARLDSAKPRQRRAKRGEAGNFQFPIIEGAKDMKTIVLAASKIAQPGDVVILSPACSSFDMFRNYKERGEQFKEEVKKLSHMET